MLVKTERIQLYHEKKITNNMQIVKRIFINILIFVINYMCVIQNQIEIINFDV